MDNNSITRKKDLLRREIKTIKRAMTPLQIAEKSTAIHRQLELMTEFQEANTILAYMALPDEVQTLSFLQSWIAKKRIVLPVVNGDTLDLREYFPDGRLQKSGSFGIMEPHQGPLVSPDEIDFAIIPGLAFDCENNRLGRGKAFYDKLLRTSGFFKVGVCFLEQLVDNVPVDEFDVKMDRVIVA
ncbi:MAG TPA: 5-formyltetrahydrofolate cyclo-ligase [Williamwhitmania sp.]|nr:5-formyltetrahydrofolate cyclo-ligase [Williamwhitmania sp.]